jgi:septal ring factor EnvC (AmiA/AmiB activator)
MDMPLLKSRHELAAMDFREEPNGLLSLQRLDDLAPMAPLLAAKEEAAARLEAVDEQAREATRRLRALGQQDMTNSFAGMVADLEARLATLTAERQGIMVEVAAANARIDDARERARAAVLPAISALALPAIQARIAELDALAMVQRLVVTQSTSHLPARQMLALELDYLRMLQDVLEGREA